jgi:hypothetical protein
MNLQTRPLDPFEFTLACDWACRAVVAQSTHGPSLYLDRDRPASMLDAVGELTGDPV